MLVPGSGFSRFIIHTPPGNLLTPHTLSMAFQTGFIIFRPTCWNWAAEERGVANGVWPASWGLFLTVVAWRMATCNRCCMELDFVIEI